MGCRVEVMAFGRSASRYVKDGADQFIDMDASRNFLIKKAV